MLRIATIISSESEPVKNSGNARYLRARILLYIEPEKEEGEGRDPINLSPTELGNEGGGKNYYQYLLLLTVQRAKKLLVAVLHVVYGTIREN